MKYRNVVTGEVIAVHFTTESAMSSYNQVVAIRTDTGEALDLTFFERLLVDIAPGRPVESAPDA